MNIDGFVYEYTNPRGAVAIDMVASNNSLSFRVMRLLRRADGKCTVSVLTFKSFAAAKDFYDGFVKYLSGKTDEMAYDICRYNPQNMCKCSPKNCPRELGGHTFWVMFRNVCRCRGA